MKKIILFAMLFMASISFANTISEERVNHITTTTETKEVSNDSNSIKTMVIQSAENYEYCITHIRKILVSSEPVFGGTIETYVYLTWTTCYEIGTTK